MTDIYVSVEQGLQVQTASTPTAIVALTAIVAVTTDGQGAGGTTITVSLPPSSGQGQWKQAVLAEIANWASLNDFNVLRVLLPDLTTAVP
jgi:hypothetical protein